MKRNFLIGISCMLAACVVLYACQKDLSSSSAARPSLSASTTNAVTGEKVTLNVNNAPLGTHLIWASSAQASTGFSANGQNSANVAFSAPGTYTITAYIVSGAGQDSLPYYDSTVIHYPPADTTSHEPVDTIQGNPHDTLPGYPHDSLPGTADTTGTHQHDTVPYNPQPPYDSSYYHPYDSTIIDSIAHLHNQHVIHVVTIVITVH